MLTTDFRGTDRFEILSRIGRGGMGIVYRALDRERNLPVALKVIEALDPHNLARFKREFRALQELQHPNLVHLGELIEDAGQWFFTMELIEGSDIITFLRNAGAAGQGARKEALLRATISQVCVGLHALHGAGKVHRDVKPENVLVDGDGRVVILDFGLVANLDSDQSTDAGAVGTYLYMAPEQGAGQAATEKADWYSVGVLLYEILAGRAPFAGPGIRVLMKKQTEEPLPPRRFNGDVPEDLDALCMDLLRIDPEARPGAREILRRLKTDFAIEPEGLRTASTQGLNAIFVGREKEMHWLEAAFAAVLQKQPKLLLLDGESGIGKTALIENFLQSRVTARPDILVLIGRCYEQEAVPYKAFDGIMDQVSRWLRKLTENGVDTVLPRNVALLAKTFPVLNRVDRIAEAPRRAFEAQDPQELRSRVFVAMRELFDRIAAHTALVVVIEDLQWSDPDSFAMLRELIRPPEIPPFLLLITLRSDALSGAEQFLVLNVGPCERIAIGTLAAEEARTLARHLLRAGNVSDEQVVDAIVAEAHGHPLFIERLAQHWSDGAAQSVCLEEALWEGVSRLGVEPRRIVELLALASLPLALEVVMEASDLEGVDFLRHIKALKIARLVRTSGLQRTDTVEIYHNRIREAVCAHLSPEEAAVRHWRLARAFESLRREDPELLFKHWEGAGEREKAAHYALRAAVRANEALAFDRAAYFYRRVLALSEQPAHAWQVELGHALARAGRGAEAAEAYATAIAQSTPVVALDLKMRAAEALLISGRFDAGIQAFHSVFQELGMQFPTTPRRALIELIRLRLWIWIRGFRYKLRHTSEIREADLLRNDACWAAAKGLGGVDVIFGQVLSARTLLHAFQLGDAYRIARALALEIPNLAVERPRDAGAREQLISEAMRLAKQAPGAQSAVGVILFYRGLAHYIHGEWRQVLDLYSRAEAIFRSECTGMVWELSTLTTTCLETYVWFGRWAEIVRRAPRAIREAQERGDLYTETFIRCGSMSFVALMQDDPEAARRETSPVIEQWSQRGFHAQHITHLRYTLLTHLYCAEFEQAERLWRDNWRALSRSFLLRVPLVRILTAQLRAGCTLAMIAADPEQRASRLRRAHRIARSVHREMDPWAQAMAWGIDAAIAEWEHKPQRAVECLQKAAQRFRACDMLGFAVAADYQRGRIQADETGLCWMRDAERWMQEQGVWVPARFAGILLPGFPGATSDTD